MPNCISGGKRSSGRILHLCSHLNIENSVIENQILLILWFMYYIKIFSNYFCYSLHWEKNKTVLPIWQQTLNFLSVNTQERQQNIFYSAKIHWSIMDETYKPIQRNEKESTSIPNNESMSCPFFNAISEIKRKFKESLSLSLLFFLIEQ